jgi:hypothetical protein
MANQTFRIYFQQSFRGRHRQNIQLPAVNTTSVVIITACEYNPEKVPPNHQNERVRNLGDANVWISNIGVHGDDGTPNNGVEFIINVDFPNPIFICVDITVLDNPASVSHI